MRYLILGGGSVTTEYYLPALRIMGRLADATIVDPAARSIASRYPEFEEADLRAQDYKAFLSGLGPAADESDCVIIALPNPFHVEAVRLSLESGRHVLCEKPLALKAQDCVDLRRMATERRRLLKLAMSRRYLPSMMLARDIVAAHELGAVRSIEVHDRMPFLWRPRSFAFFSPESGGVLADMGVHYLDYLDMLMGPLEPLAYSDDARGGNESSLDYSLRAGAVPIEMRLSRIHQSGAYIRIACERGEIRIDKARENEITVTPSGLPARRVRVDRPFDEATWPATFHGSFCQMLADFEAAIEGRTTRIADAVDAERAVALIEWAYRRRNFGAAAPPDGAARSDERRKVLVTGGTGFIGGHLVERLSGRDLDTRVAARSPGSCANVVRFPVDLVATDLLDRGSVRAAIDGARIVYHLAYGNDGARPERITIDGTKNVIEAAIEAKVECVVVLSTMYVFGFPHGAGAVDESFPYRPYGGEYGASKAAMEQWVLERAKTALPTRIVVLNPTCVYGPGGGAYTCLPTDLARKGQFCWIDEGSGTGNYTYVENLVDAIVAAGEVPGAHANRFIISDGATTWREFLGPFIGPARETFPSYTPEELNRLPRHGGPFKFRDLFGAALSAPQVRNVAKRSALVRRAFALASRVRPRPPMGADRVGPLAAIEDAAETGAPPEWLASLYGPADTLFSAAKARAVLNWTPRIDLASGQAATVKWLIEDGRLEAPPASGRD